MDDEVMDVRHATRLFDLFHRGIFLGVPQVLKDRTVEQIRLLRHYADALPKVRQIEITHIDTCDAHRTAVNVI